MLHQITKISDPLVELVRDDPVRPDIPIEFRISDSSCIFVLLSDDEYRKPQAVVCVAYKDLVPRDVVELSLPNQDLAKVAVFYTIWSYVPGAGRKLIQEACAWIKVNTASIKQYVTLSPPTEMAKVFHLRNGAGILSVNADTINYIYQ